MELLQKLSNLELTTENKIFINDRSNKYKNLSQKHLDKKILNSYCVLLALLKAKYSS